MWKAVQTIRIFEDDEINIQEKCFEDGTNPVSKKFKGADRTKESQRHWQDLAKKSVNENC